MSNNKHCYKLNIFFPTVFAVIAFAVYVPCSLFLSNLDEFKFGFVQIIPWVMIASLCMFAGIFLVALIVPEKVFPVYYALVFGVALGLYLQSNFLNPHFEVLNGTDIDWSRYSARGVLSVVVWIACIVVPVILAVARRDHLARFIKVTKYISLFISLVLLATLVTLVVTSPKKDTEGRVFTKDGEFTVSKGNNTIVFIVDTLDTQHLENYILPDSLYSEMLEGFTYFDDVVAGGAPTALGVPTLFTGEVYDPKGTREAWFRDAQESSSLFNDIKEKGYNIRIYSDTTYFEYSDFELIDNTTVGEVRMILPFVFTYRLYRLSSFIALPQPLKKLFLIDSSRLTSLYKSEGGGKEAYHFDDPQFYSDMKTRGLELNDSDAFIVYHLFGAHGPVTMDADCNEIPEGTGDIGSQIRGCFRIMSEYIDMLKAAGVYDHCTFIITADHGGAGLYQNPAVLIRKPGQEEPIETDSSPVTFANLRSSMAESVLGENEGYGQTLFQVGESDNAVRYHTADNMIGRNIFPGDDRFKKGGYSMFSIKGRARDMENIEYIRGTEGS